MIGNDVDYAFLVKIPSKRFEAKSVIGPSQLIELQSHRRIARLAAAGAVQLREEVRHATQGPSHFRPSVDVDWAELRMDSESSDPVVCRFKQ